MRMHIGLSLEEITMSAHAGMMREISAIRDDRNLDRGRTDTGFEAHILGAIGEYAVAKALGITWRPAIGRLDSKDGDVAGLQVRATTYATGHLILREPDPPGDYVLVCLDLRRQTAVIVGWQDAAVAKDMLYWREGQSGRAGAYWVPQSVLLPWETLREAVA